MKRRSRATLWSLLILGVLGGQVLATNPYPCPGDETPGSRDDTIVGILHGVTGTHVVQIYTNYLTDWNECYMESEYNGFDAYDETVQHGTTAATECNCGDIEISKTKTVTASVTYTASLSGESTTAIQVALGWPDVLAVASLGSQTTYGWECSVSTSETYEDEVQVTVPADTLWYAYVYTRIAHRQGLELDVDQGTMHVWCATHNCDGGNLGEQIDYDGEINVATEDYPMETGAIYDTETPCSAPIVPSDTLRPDDDQTYPDRPTYWEGKHWYDGQP